MVLPCAPAPWWNGRPGGPAVPTLFRFLAVIAVIGALIAGAMFALATLVEPEPREMSVTVPPSRLAPKQAP